jgi:hypothetical protein
MGWPHDKESRIFVMPFELEPGDRIAPIGYINQAVIALNAIHDKWVLKKPTQAAAVTLEPVIKHLGLMAITLSNTNMDHHAVANDLGVIFTQLMVVDDLRLVKPMFDVARARRKILGQQN